MAANQAQLHDIALVGALGELMSAAVVLRWLHGLDRLMAWEFAIRLAQLLAAVGALYGVLTVGADAPIGWRAVVIGGALSIGAIVLAVEPLRRLQRLTLEALPPQTFQNVGNLRT